MHEPIKVIVTTRQHFVCTFFQIYVIDLYLFDYIIKFLFFNITAKTEHFKNSLPFFSTRFYNFVKFKEIEAFKTPW